LYNHDSQKIQKHQIITHTTTKGVSVRQVIWLHASVRQVIWLDVSVRQVIWLDFE
jgi:hypothetical protein